MENKKIENITNEIRQYVKLGDSKMVWRKINELKNNKTYEKYTLRKKMGNLLKITKKYLKL